MGDKITHRRGSKDLAGAEFLRASRREGLGTTASAASMHPTIHSATTAPNLDDPSVQKAYLEQLVECAPEAVSILDDRDRIVRINSEFTRMFGFTPEEAVGKQLSSLIVPIDRTAETKWIASRIQGGEKVQLATRRKRKDGTLVDVHISSTGVMVEGKQVAAFALYRDLSEQKRAEALSSALYRIAEKTSSAEDLQNFYCAIHRIVGELMYAQNLYIALYDSNSQLLTFPYFVDEEDSSPPPKKLGRGLTEYVLRTGEPLLCTPEVFDTLVKRGEVELIGAASLDWLGVPLRAG